MKLKIDKESCFKKDLIIPKGYRLLEDWEFLKEIRTNKILRKLLIETYCWCKFNNKIGAVRFSDYGDRFLVDGYDLFDYGDGHSRGVFVKIGDKEKEDLTIPADCCGNCKHSEYSTRSLSWICKLHTEIKFDDFCETDICKDFKK